MKQNKKMNWKTLREEILTVTNWSVTLDADDLNAIAGADDDSVVIAEAQNEDAPEKRFQTISKSILNQLSMVDLTSQSSITMLLFMQFPMFSPITMTEMSNVDELLDNIIPEGREYEIKWGISPREDNVSRIVCAIKT